MIEIADEIVVSEEFYNELAHKTRWEFVKTTFRVENATLFNPYPYEAIWEGTQLVEIQACSHIALLRMLWAKRFLDANPPDFAYYGAMHSYYVINALWFGRMQSRLQMILSTANQEESRH